MKPSLFQRNIWFNTLTALCITVLGALFVGGVWLTGEVLAYLQPVLVPLAVAGILAYLIEPVIHFFTDRGMSRMKAIVIVFVVGAFSVGSFSTMIAVPLGNQVKKLNANKGEYFEKGKKMIGEFGKTDALVDALPQPIQNLIPKTEESYDEEKVEVIKAEPVILPVEADSHLGGNPEPLALVDFLSVDSLVDSLQSNAPRLMQRLVETVTRGAFKFFGIVGYALGFILVPVYLFFFLKESANIQKNWRKFVPLRSSKFKDEVVSVVAEINGYLIAFFRGQIFVSLIDGFLVGLILKFCGHPFAILLGIALAVLGVIPFIGNIICLIPAAVTAYAHFSLESEQYWLGDNPWMYVIMVVTIFVVVQQINSLVTAPKIVGDSVGLHPMTVIFSMLFWSLLLGGFLGALLAVPLTASVKVLFRRYIWERKVMHEEVSL